MIGMADEFSRADTFHISASDAMYNLCHAQEMLVPLQQTRKNYTSFYFILFDLIFFSEKNTSWHMTVMLVEPQRIFLNETDQIRDMTQVSEYETTHYHTISALPCIKFTRVKKKGKKVKWLHAMTTAADEFELSWSSHKSWNDSLRNISIPSHWISSFLF